MSETTKEERDEMRRVIDNDDGRPVVTLFRTEAREVVNDADRLAAIERQVLWRDERVPAGAVAWIKYEHGLCFWMMRERWQYSDRCMCAVTKPANIDYRPDDDGPFFLLMLEKSDV